MWLIAIVLSVSALLFASGAIAQSPSTDTDQKPSPQRSTRAEYPPSYSEKRAIQTLPGGRFDQRPQRMPGLPWAVSVASVVCQVARCYGLAA